MTFTKIINALFKNEIHISTNSNKSKFKLLQKFLNMPDDNDKTKLITIFCNAQKVFHTLTKYIRIKKTRESDIRHDLLYTELSFYKEHLKMSFSHNDTMYTFLLRDLHKLWKTALVTNENMIPTPIPLKNPYDNIAFKKHTLYNIYFTMLFSGLHIDPLIHYFFKVNFNLRIFVNDNYVRLYEISLQDYTEETLSSNSNMYTFIKNIKVNYPLHSKNIYVHDDLPLDIRKYCVTELKTVLIFYCMMSFAIDFSCLNSKIEEYEKKFLHELKKVNKYIFCRPYLIREKINGKRRMLSVNNKYYYFEKEHIIYGIYD
jgi:hypothetical protein